MEIESTDKRREALLKLKEKLMYAEQQRLAGEPTISLDEAEKHIQEKIGITMASESSLSKDWESEDEDKAWEDL